MNAKKFSAFIKKQPVVIGCAILSLVVAAAIFLRNRTLVEAQAELDDQRTEGEHLQENIDNAGKLDEQLAQITQAIPTIEARLVHADQLAVNLQYFYKLESDTGTKLSQLRQTGVLAPAKNATKSAYVGVGYVINVKGTYSQMLDFLRRVENGEHFSHLQSVSLTGSTNDMASSNTKEFTLNLNFQLLGQP